MNMILETALSNALVVVFLSLIVLAVSRVCRSPTLVHSMWLIVILKLVTPPIMQVPVSVSWLESNAYSTDLADESAFHPAVINQQKSVFPDKKISRGDFEAATVRSNADSRSDLDRKTDVEFSGLAKSEVGVDSAAMVNGPSMLYENPEGFGPEVRENAEYPGWKSRAEDGKVAIQESGRKTRDPASINGHYSVTAFLWNASDLFNVALFVWIGGAISLFAWNLFQIGLFQFRLRMTVPAPRELQKETEDLAASMGLSCCPQVFLMSGVISPMLWAVGRQPRLIFPKGLLHRLDAESRKTLLLHELAHFRRKDHWVRVMELLAVCIYWWHPVAWWARREIRISEEECCDAWVVSRLPAGGCLYASALIDTLDFLAESRSGIPPVASGIGNIEFLKRRLTLIMQGTVSERLSGINKVGVICFAMLVISMVPALADVRLNQTTDVQAITSSKKTLPEEKSTPNTLENENVFTLQKSMFQEPTEFEITPFNFNGFPKNNWRLAISPDGKRLAVGDILGVKLWDAQSGELRHQLDAPYRYSNGHVDLVFSKDGQLLARTGTGGKKKGKVVPIWSMQTGEKLFELRTASEAGAFSGDNKQFAVGLSDRQMALAIFQLSGRVADTAQPPAESTRNKMQAGSHYRGKKAEEFIDNWKPVWGKPQLGIQYGVALTTQQRQFRVGERVRLAVFFRNVSDKPLRLDHRPDFYWIMPKVTDANSKGIEFEKVALLGIAPHYRDKLEPGEAFGPLYVNFGLGENPRPGKQNWTPFWKSPVSGQYKLTHGLSFKIASPEAGRDETSDEWKSGALTSGQLEFTIIKGGMPAANDPLGLGPDKQPRAEGVVGPDRKPQVPAKVVVAKELERFQGTWAMDLCDSETKDFGDSQEVVKQWRWSIKGNEVVWSRSRDEVWKLTISVDPAKSPNEIDLTFLDGPHKGETCLGMYKWGGVNKKMLLMSVQDPGAKVARPTSISMQGGGQTSLIFLEPMDAEKEMASLQGTWKFDIIQTDGWPKTSGKGPDRSGHGDDLQWVIKGNEINRTSRNGEEGRLSFTIDPTKSPMHFDVTFLSGPNKGRKCLGIYERGGVGGVGLWFCLVDPGSMAPRPTNVSYETNKGRTMIGLIRSEPR